MAEDMVLEAWGTRVASPRSRKSSFTEAREGPDPEVATPPSRRRARSEAEYRGAGC
jgi:hypothetical protein